MLDKFVVVKDDDHGKKDDDHGKGSSNMEELKQLNNLCRQLEIEILADVGSEEEAASAHLELKRYLSRITLRYETPNQSTSSDAVLQALRPHFNLSELSIFGYPSSKLPTWLGDSSFSGLHKLTLHDCTGCTTLPAIGNLPELRSLSIDGMPRVRRLTSDLFGSMHGFPKLDSLEFQNLEEWEPLVDRVKENNSLVAPIDGGGVTGEERIFNFPCLIEFEISNCPKLRSLPPIFSASLQNVNIGGSMDLSNWEWSFLINIDTLTCESAELLNRLPSLPNLRSLRINDDDVVSELSNSLLKLSSLQTLNICYCENLKSLPEEMASLNQLRKLEIWRCPLLEQSCSEGGEQWHRISHIPDIRVGLRDVLRNLPAIHLSCPTITSTTQTTKRASSSMEVKIGEHPLTPDPPRTDRLFSPAASLSSHDTMTSSSPWTFTDLHRWPLRSNWNRVPSRSNS